MSIPRIYYPQHYRSGDTLRLTMDASRHLLKALRLRLGEAVILFDGAGGEYVGKLSAVDNGLACIRVEAYQSGVKASSLQIRLIYGLARFEKTEWVIQKATELGVSQIVPIITQHGEVSLSAQAAEKRLLRWRAIIIAACEQSGRTLLPEITKPLSFEAWVKASQPEATTRLIFHPQSQMSLSEVAAPPTSTVDLLVGPEGGFSSIEVEIATQYGFTAVGLGPRILRTETAAISAVTAAQVLWGDFC